MVRGRADSNGLLTVPEGVEIATGPGQYIGLRDFLWDAGFPITPPPAAPGIFTMEVSGLAGVSPTGAVGIWRDPYFLHRSLVDDQGSAICLGLDEDIENANNLPFTARLEPCVGKELPERIARRRLVPPGWQPGHSPLVRYVYYPLPATMTLPLIDAPVISNQWVDLFLYPDGAGLAFIPRPGRERDEPGPRLSELWGYHLHKKNHRLLGLTHDKDHVMEYLDAKMRILAEAFEIIRFPP